MSEDSKILSAEEFMAIDDSIDVDETYQEKTDPEQTQIKIKEVGELCEAAEKQQDKVNELSQQLKNEEAKLKELLEVKIPETLEAAGMKELKLTSGKKITIIDELAFNIPEAKRPACMDWLRKNNYDSIIKNIVSAQFAKGEDKAAIEWYRKLLAAGLNASHKEDVHWQTMKAFLKEQSRNNTMSTADKELFGVYEYKIAKIK